MSGPSLEIVDDRDPRVQYTGVWVPDGVKREYNSTTSAAHTAGSQAMLIFQGTSVQVFGTTSFSHTSLTDPPVSTYHLDGSLAGVFSPALEAVNTTTYRRLFYQSPVLDIGQHNLTITSHVSGATLWLDYFVVASDKASVPSFSTSSSSPIFTTAISTTHVKANISVGLIVVGVIGSAALILSLALFYIFYQQQQKKHKNPSSCFAFYKSDSNSSKGLGLSPFTDWGRIDTRVIGGVAPSKMGRIDEISGTSQLHAPRDVTHYQSNDDDLPRYAPRA